MNVTESDNISDGKTIPLYNMHVDFYCEKQKLTTYSAFFTTGAKVTGEPINENSNITQKNLR